MAVSSTSKVKSNDVSGRSQDTCCFLEDLPIAKITDVPLFDCHDLGTDVNNTVQAVSVFYCEAVKPADKRKAQETLNKRLIKTTEDDRTYRKGI